MPLWKLSGYWPHLVGVPGKRAAVVGPGFLSVALWRWSGWSMRSMGLWHGCVTAHVSNDKGVYRTDPAVNMGRVKKTQ